jgi:hypothetical protein
MLRRSILAGMLIMGAACVPANETIIADGQTARVDAIEQAEQQLNRLAQTWRAEGEVERARFSRRFVFPACGHPDAPTDVRCGLVHKVYSSDEFQKQFAATHCSPGAWVATDQICSDKLVGEFIRVIEQRYRLRFIDLCKGGAACMSFLQTELRAMRAGNRQAADDYSYKMQILRSKHEAEANDILAALDAELGEIQHWTQARLEEAESQRAVLRGLAKKMQSGAAGLNAYAQTLQESSLAAGSYGSGLKECNSDYVCGTGFICVKEPGRFQGVCDRRLNAYGAPSFDAPRLDSFGPGWRQCFSIAECPVGFSCVAGNCRRP